MTRAGQWTVHAVDTLLAMRDEGKPWAEIAAAIGKSVGATASYWRDRNRRLGIPPPPAPKASRLMTSEEASEALRVEIIMAIDRYARANRIHVDKAARALLSGPVDNGESAQIYAGARNPARAQTCR